MYYEDDVVLCVSNAYEKKFYMNPDFNGLPDHIKKELKIMCVLFTEDVGGIMMLEYDENGTLQIKTEAAEEDILYDERHWNSILRCFFLMRMCKTVFDVCRHGIMCADIWCRV